MTDTVRSLQNRFPKTPVIVMSHNGCALLGRSEAFRVDAIVGSSALDGALMELARLRVIDHAIALHTAVSAAVKFMVAHYGDQSPCAMWPKQQICPKGASPNILP